MTSDSKLQLWDIAVSDIDPVVSIDTNLDYAESPGGLLEKSRLGAIEAAVAAAASAAAVGTAPGQRKITAGGNLRNHRTNLRGGDEEKDGSGAESSAVAKLMKNLTGPGKRILTSVLFGLKSPVVAVGDNRGTVIVYRILNPVTVSHEPAAVQTMNLQTALARQDSNLIAASEEDNKSIATLSIPEDRMAAGES